jgi:hypothetical protein
LIREISKLNLIGNWRAKESMELDNRLRIFVILMTGIAATGVFVSLYVITGLLYGEIAQHLGAQYREANLNLYLKYLAIASALVVSGSIIIYISSPRRQQHKQSWN